MLPSTSFLYNESLIDTNKPSHIEEVFIEHILVASSLESRYIINTPCERQCFPWAKHLNPSILKREKVYCVVQPSFLNTDHMEFNILNLSDL